jgi:hypothetical protein
MRDWLSIAALFVVLVGLSFTAEHLLAAATPPELPRERGCGEVVFDVYATRDGMAAHERRRSWGDAFGRRGDFCVSMHESPVLTASGTHANVYVVVVWGEAGAKKR